MSEYRNLDAGESVFFNRELEHIKNASYDVKFPEYKAASGRVMPISTEAGEGADSIVYRTYEEYGIAKVIANYGDDLPRADVKGKETPSPVVTIGTSFGYNTQEVRASAKTGKRLPQRKADSARRADLQKVESIAWNGDASGGLQGVINYPNIQTYTVPADGIGTTTEWVNKSPDQILRDMNRMVDQVIETTKGIEIPNVLYMPIAQYTLISSTARSDNSDLTILEYFLRNRPGVRVDWINQLKGAGTAGADVMMAWVNDPMHLTLEIPMPFKQNPAQERGLEFVIPCESRNGGVIVYYPLSVIKGEGI